MDKILKQLVTCLKDGKESCKSGGTIEAETRIDRITITKLILENNIPVGSNSKGYFLIDDEKELQEVISSIDKRIEGLNKRKTAIIEGWAKRKNVREKKGINWPKETEEL